MPVIQNLPPFFFSIHTSSDSTNQATVSTSVLQCTSQRLGGLLSSYWLSFPLSWVAWWSCSRVYWRAGLGCYVQWRVGVARHVGIHCEGATGFVTLPLGWSLCRVEWSKRQMHHSSSQWLSWIQSQSLRLKMCRTKHGWINGGHSLHSDIRLLTLHPYPNSLKNNSPCWIGKVTLHVIAFISILSEPCWTMEFTRWGPAKGWPNIALPPFPLIVYNHIRIIDSTTSSQLVWINFSNHKLFY